MSRDIINLTPAEISFVFDTANRIANDKHYSTKQQLTANQLADDIEAWNHAPLSEGTAKRTITASRQNISLTPAEIGLAFDTANQIASNKRYSAQQQATANQLADDIEAWNYHD